MAIGALPSVAAKRKRASKETEDAQPPQKKVRSPAFVLDSENYMVTVSLFDAKFTVPRNVFLRGDNVLSSKFADRWSGAKGKREIFIEGNGDVFKEVLRYLMQPEDFVPPRTYGMKADLHAMAERLCMSELASKTKSFSITKVDGFVKIRNGQSWELGWKRGEDVLMAEVDLPILFKIKFQFDGWNMKVQFEKGIFIGLIGENRCQSCIRTTRSRLWFSEGAFCTTPTGMVTLLQERSRLVSESLKVTEIPTDAVHLAVWPEWDIVAELLQEEDKSKETVYAIVGFLSERCRIYDTGFLATMPDGSLRFGLTQWQDGFGQRYHPFYMVSFPEVGTGHLVDIDGSWTSMVLSGTSMFTQVDINNKNWEWIRSDINTAKKRSEKAVMTFQAPDCKGSMTISELSSEKVLFLPFEDPIESSSEDEP